MNRNKTALVAQASMIAALYVVLTYLCSLLGLSNGAVQLRFSEALTILPIFMPSAVPGLFVGCVLSNLLTGSALWDIVFGSVATLIGAHCTRRLRRFPHLALLPPIVANTLILPPVIVAVYGSEFPTWLVYVTVFVGEALSCGVLGSILYRVLNKNLAFQRRFGLEENNKL